MANNISYKCFLTGAGFKPRIERFKIDRKVRHSVMFLKEKLYRTYDGLQGKQFKITWRDDDGDDVSINSNESLSIALNEQDGPIYKIYVEVLGEEEKDDKTHPGVVCDGCEQPVMGNRYKCLVCKDYDLCRNCEIKGLHPGHNMVRMTRIEDSKTIAQNDNRQKDWHQNFFQKFQNLKNQHNSQKTSKNNITDNRKRSNTTDNRKRSNSLIPHGAARKGSRSPSPYRARSSSVNKDAPNITQGVFHGTEPPNANGGMFQGVVINGGKDEKNTYIGQMVGPQTKDMKNSNVGPEGVTQSTTPDPFGVRERGKEEKKVAKEKKQETEKPDTSPKTATSPIISGPILWENTGSKNPNKQEEEPCEDLGDANQDIPSIPIAEVKEKIKKCIIEKLRKEGKGEDETDYFYSSDEDEWTVMPRNSASSTSSDSSVEMITPPSSTLYPTLPKTDQTPQIEKNTAKKNAESQGTKRKPEAKHFCAEASSANLSLIETTSNAITMPTNNIDPLQTTTSKQANQSSTNPVTPINTPAPIAIHPNGKIRIALQAMLNMGFTNDGGWLSSLLEAKNGDIGLVLDVLSPVRR